MNNEPVAWMMKAREPSLHSPDYITFEKPTRDMKISHQPTPLYNHPIKNLEDIDINITWNENSMRDFGKDELAFARAILRKAQEK